MSYTTDAARWRALTTRDSNANGLFVYSVKSTNIYCRPTCPARLARRANVGFYKTPSEAEINGFRACKRCKPDSILEDPQQQAVEKACKLIDEALRKNNEKAIRLQDLAKSVGLTTRYFHKIFKDKTGMTPKEYSKSRGSEGSSSSATPVVTESSVGAETANWDDFDFNNFSDLVEFDPDESATLGYSLITGATQPIEMGFGNEIDVNVLHKMWNTACEPDDIVAELPLSSDETMSSLDPVIMPDVSDWRIPEDFISSFDFDAATLLGCDSLQVMF